MVTDRVNIRGLRRVRIENFEDFGRTINGKLSARASVTTGFRAPPGQQNGFNGTIPSNFLRWRGCSAGAPSPSGDVGQLPRRGRLRHRARSGMRRASSCPPWRSRRGRAGGRRRHLHRRHRPVHVQRARAEDLRGDVLAVRAEPGRVLARRDPSPALVDRGGPRAPPPAPDNLRLVRTWLSRGRTARLPRRSSHLRTC